MVAQAPVLADTLRDAAAGVAGPADVHAAFLGATVYCERGRAPGFRALGAAGAGVVPVFTSPEQLALARGTVAWFSLPGAELLDLLPDGYDLVLDIGGDTPLRLRPAALDRRLLVEAEAAADAPSQAGVQRPGPLPAVHAGGATVRVVAEHELARPEEYIAPIGGLVDSVHFGQDHQVEFAGAESGTGWQEWSEQSAGRGLGRVEPGLLAALGIGAATVLGRRRRDRTAFALAGLDEAEIRSRRSRRSRRGRREQEGAAPAVSGRLRGPHMWRTRLASPPRAGGTVHPWAGPEANPLPRVRSAEAVRLPAAERRASGVVQRTGTPADERRPGSGRGTPH
jgi:hypothetical protein